MKYLVIFLLTMSMNLFAVDNGVLIFEDDFERSEKNEQKEDPGNGWESNSEKRAKGNKQLDLIDGALHISTHPKADHGAVASHLMGFQNGTIAMKVKFESADDVLNINVADSKEKSVWAGHLFSITLRPSGIQLTDLKTGNMKLAIVDAKKAKTLTQKEKKMLKEKTKSFSNKLGLNKWHQVILVVKDNEITCTINGKVKGKFRSEGFAHPIKRELRLIVKKNIYVDEIRVWRND